MPRWLAIPLCCTCLLAGCTVWTQVARTVNHELHYQWTGWHVRDYERELAREAWTEFAAQNSEAFSEDYRLGFFDGFAAYVHTGFANPPSVPPPRYRYFRYYKPELSTAAEHWFTGYQMGASLAAESGIREALTVPVLLLPPPNVAYHRPDLIVPLVPPGNGVEPLPPAFPEPEPTPAPPPGSRPLPQVPLPPQELLPPQGALAPPAGSRLGPGPTQFGPGELTSPFPNQP